MFLVDKLTAFGHQNIVNITKKKLQCQWPENSQAFPLEGLLIPRNIYLIQGKMLFSLEI